jgi:hypothetical protein
MTKAHNPTDQESFPTINRFAILLEPTEAFLEWAKKCPDGDPELTLKELRDEGTVYLIPETDAMPENWLKRNYKIMFEHELKAWYTDEDYWPKPRSFKIFKMFFNIRFSSIILDMGKGSIDRGSY